MRVPTPLVPVWLNTVLWISLLLGAVTLGMCLFFLPTFSNTEWMKEAVVDHLNQSLEGNTRIETLEVNIFPSPSVDVTGFTAETLTPSRVRFKAKRLSIGIGWESFWKKHFVLHQIIIDEPDLMIEFPLTSTTEEDTGEPLPLFEKLIIRDGRLNLTSKSADQSVQVIHTEDFQLTITHNHKDDTYPIQLSTNIVDQQFPSQLIFEGKLTSLPPEESSSPKENESAWPSIHIAGRIQGKDMNLGRLQEFVEGHTGQPPIQTKVNIQGNISYTFREESDLLELEPLRLALNDWSFTGQIKLADLFHDTTQIDISGSSSPVALAQLPSLLPRDWLPDAIQQILHQHQVTGDLMLERGSFQIPLQENALWKTEGILRVDHGQFRPAPDQPLLTDISGTIMFSPSIFQFINVRGHIAPLAILVPQATLALENDSLQLQISEFQISENNWSLNGLAEYKSSSDSPSILRISASSLPFSIRHIVTILPPVWIPKFVQTVLNEQEIDGEVELVTGSFTWKDDNDGPFVAEGIVRMNDGQVLFDPNHPPLKNLSGGIVFDGNLLRILNMRGRIEASTILVREATLELADSEVLVDILGEGILDGHDVFQAVLRDPRSLHFQEFSKIFRDAQGNMRFSTRLQGSLTHPDQLQILDSRLEFNNVGLFSTTSTGLSIQQLNGKLSFDDKGIRIQRFNGLLGDSPIDMKGQWSFRKNSQASNFTIRSTLSSADLHAMFPDIGNTFSSFEGRIPTALSLSGSTLRPEYQAQFDLTNMVLTAKNVFHKPLGIPAKMALKGSVHDKTAIRMTQGQLSIPPYSLEGHGHVSWSDPPYIRGFFQTVSGTGAIFPEGVIIGDGRLNLSSLGLIWNLEGKNWDWTTWAMKGKVEGSNRKSQTTTSSLNNDIQSASIKWAQTNQKGKGEISLKGIPIESLSGSQTVSPPPLTGTTSLTTSLVMDLESSEQMQRSLTGKGNVQLQKGVIQTGPVLTKILGILNVPSLLMGKVNLSEEGLPFDELTGSFSLDDGLLTTKDLALKSPVLKLTAAGSYELSTENLDTMIAVSPFGAYSNLLKDIPLFGSLMKGERKGLLTALFQVKGTRTQPEVVYLPMDSFTGGLKGLAQFPIDVLKNIITIPVPDKEKSEPMPSP